MSEKYFILEKTFRYSFKLAKQYYFNQLSKQDISCPAFGSEQIAVTREGWEHLVHAERKSKLDVFGRFFVLESVQSLLESAQQATYYRKTDSTEYWGFEGIVENVRLRVIIREIDKSGKHLYSVIRLGML
jgi:hypothetical protein